MPTLPRVSFAFVLFGLLLLATNGLHPAVAQITSNTALPVGRGEMLVRVQTKLIRSTGDPTDAGRELEVVGFPLVGVYGVSARLTLFGVFPIVFKSLHLTGESGRLVRDTKGLGDVRLFARYTVYQLNQSGRTLRLAPFVGLELPTGSAARSDVFGRFPRPFQLGSGTWDPYIGIVLTRQTLAWQVDASVSYLLGTQTDDFRPGSDVRANLASKVRVLPRRLQGGLPRFIYANLETSLIWKGQDEEGGAASPNSGGTTWYIAPGAQFVTRRVILEAAVQLPVVQELNGTGLRNDFIVTISGRLNF
jgi:hypothetical protein